MSRIKIAALIVASAFVVDGNGQEIPQKMQPIVDRIEKSVVKMKVYIDEQYAGHGTGWYVAEDRIVTNYHMLGAFLDLPNRVAVKAQFKGSDQEYPITEMLSYDQHNDAVVLVAPKKATPLSIAGKDLKLKEGQRLFFLGNPGEDEFVARFGPIASTAKQFDEPLGVRTNLEIQVVAAGGASGSPVFNENGEVVSMVMGGTMGGTMGVTEGGAVDSVEGGLCLDPPTLFAVVENAKATKPQKIANYVRVFMKSLGNPGDLVAVVDGNLSCTARNAETHGEEIQFETTDSGITGNIGFWMNGDDWLSWNLNVAEAGRYRVRLTSACPAETAGTSMTLEILKKQGDEAKAQLATFRVEATGGYVRYNEHDLGTITLAAGKQRLALKAKEKPDFAVMNLKSIVLQKVRDGDQKTDKGERKGVAGGRKAEVDNAEFDAFFKSIDKSGDGKIQLSEAPEEHLDDFNEADQDSDNIVTREELFRLFTNHMIEEQGPQASSIDKDIAIQFEEAVRIFVDDQPVKVESPGYACPSFADMNGDGLKDLLVGQFRDGKIKVFPNDGKNGFQPGAWLRAGGRVAEIPGVW